MLQKARRVPAGFEGLEKSLADIYYGNFSVFQSLPDVWAVEQLFPIMPMHRHTEQPTRRAILADITCDSDGKIDRFIESRDVKRRCRCIPGSRASRTTSACSWSAPTRRSSATCTTCSATPTWRACASHADGTFEFVREMSGDSISDVLSYVEYQPQQLLERLRRTAERPCARTASRSRSARRSWNPSAASLRGYTYYED